MYDKIKVEENKEGAILSMYELKTKETENSVIEFIERVDQAKPTIKLQGLMFTNFIDTLTRWPAFQGESLP